MKGFAVVVLVGLAFATNGCGYNTLVTEQEQV